MPVINYNGLKVNYQWRLNGGGIVYAWEFVRLVSRKIGKVEHAFEFGAGPGFIGFCLLANRLCDRLTLADINPQAIQVICETIHNNRLQDRVKVYQSDVLDSIPSGERWDLVVGNPPWYLCPQKGRDMRVCDPHGLVHEKFYRDVRRFLKPNGSILFIEGGEYTNALHFKGMIGPNGLRMIESFRPVSWRTIFKGLNEYQGLNWLWVILIRGAMLLRDTYFIWSKLDERSPNGRLNQKPVRGGYPEAQIFQIGRKQKPLGWIFLGLLAGLALLPTPAETAPLLIAIIWAIWGIYQLALALHKKHPGLWALGAGIPPLSFMIIAGLWMESKKVLSTATLTIPPKGEI